MASKKELTAAEISMLPRAARPLAFPLLNEKEMAAKYADRVRHGKTKRDKAKRPAMETSVDG